MWNVTSQRLEVVIGEVTNLKDPRGSEGKGEIFDTSCSFLIQRGGGRQQWKLVQKL